MDNIRNDRLRIAEAVNRWGNRSDEDNNLEPLDLSVIERLFRACDPDSPDYDREFHLELFQQKPHFFGPNGLPIPRD